MSPFDTPPAADRLRILLDRPPAPDAAYVLYWMTANRRLRWNWALDRALEWSRRLGLPLLIFEPLGVEYPYASIRLHRFALDGMRDHRDALRDSPVGYLPWVERERGEGRGLLAALAARAAVVVGDDLPGFIQPGLLRGAVRGLTVRLEVVDAAGVVPLRFPGRTFTTAYSFRRWLQKNLREFLASRPFAEIEDDGLSVFPGLPVEVTARWPVASDALLDASEGLEALPIDHRVPIVAESPGGPVEAHRRLDVFLRERIDRYGERNHPDVEAASTLSPWLHWGHLAAHEVVQTVLDREGWTPARLAEEAAGKREGWWGLSEGAEGFLDEILTWREIGLNGAATIPDPKSWGSLPEWARVTMEAHAADPRPGDYSLDELRDARTEDPIWNAAQRQLRQDGIIHNYLRMLWGKKILEWSATPQEALEILFELNDRYALDGRDANSISGIMWTLGRYDRGWPERAVFGKVRSMSSDSTRRKLQLKGYLNRYGPNAGRQLEFDAEE